MTVWQVILMKEAQEDLRLGRAFYDEADLGVGNYFFSSLMAEVESLRLYAGIHGLEFDCHKMLAKRFPFGIYYDIVDDVARVVAILDLRQHPDKIRESLKLR